jgi:hypothetical protein
MEIALPELGYRVYRLGVAARSIRSAGRLPVDGRVSRIVKRVDATAKGRELKGKQIKKLAKNI